MLVIDCGQDYYLCVLVTVFMLSQYREKRISIVLIFSQLFFSSHSSEENTKHILYFSLSCCICLTLYILGISVPICWFFLFLLSSFVCPSCQTEEVANMACSKIFSVFFSSPNYLVKASTWKNIASNRKNILSLNRQFKVAGGCRARFCDGKHNTKQKKIEVKYYK